MLFELDSSKWFSQYISRLEGRTNKPDFNFPLYDSFPDEMVVNLYVFTRCMKQWILGQLYGRLIVAMNL